MDDLEQTIELAKRGQFSRARLYAELEKRSRDLIAPGVSAAQAFVKFAFGEGRALYDVYRATEGRDFNPVPVTTLEKRGVTDDWTSLIKAMRRAYGGTESQAIDACLKTEAGRFAFAKVKRAQQIASGQFTKADMQCLDGIAADHDEALAKRDLPTDYEVECDHVRQMYPHMKESDVHDHARARNPEAWAQHKLGKMGGGNLPQPRHQVQQAGDEHPQAARSGRKQPSRAPQWESDHSGSPATTPEHEPERMDNKPAVKVLNDLQRHTGLERERLIPILKRIPIGKRLLDMAVAEL
jgi:hypothetical protein